MVTRRRQQWRPTSPKLRPVLRSRMETPHRYETMSPCATLCIICEAHLSISSGDDGIFPLFPLKRLNWRGVLKASVVYPLLTLSLLSRNSVRFSEALDRPAWPGDRRGG